MINSSMAMIQKNSVVKKEKKDIQISFNKEKAKVMFNFAFELLKVSCVILLVYLIIQIPALIKPIVYLIGNLVRAAIGQGMLLGFILIASIIVFIIFLPKLIKEIGKDLK